MTIRHLFAVILLIVLVVLVAPQLSLLSAQQRAAAQNRCIGIATSVLRSQNPVVTRLYRIFDDGGSVEAFDDGAPGADGLNWASESS